MFETSTLYTFAASRPLRALYFDGFSAVKTGMGTLDLQAVLVFGKANDYPHDYERGLLLCDWGRQFGIEGSVREEATFEVTLNPPFLVQTAQSVVSCCGATSRMGFSRWTLPTLHYPHPLK